MKKRGPWKIKSSKMVYTNPWMSVREDSVVRPDGKPGIYGVVSLRYGVGVIALDNKNNVYLTKEFHYGTGRVTIEAVSGGIENGDSALNTAKRELKEEVGIVAKKWINLGALYPLTSIVDMKNILYLAQDLSIVANNPEGTEKIKIIKIPLKKALNLVQQGKISDATTVIGLMKAAKFLKQV